MTAVTQDLETSNNFKDNEFKSTNGEVTAVADIPPTPTPRHPLNSSWTLWYFLKDKNLSWKESLIKVSTFNTVEDFWALMNHIEVPSRLKIGCDYNLFRTGVEPMWEDPVNKEGGKWMFSISRNQRSVLDSYFQELAMMLVGENEDEDVINQINGVVVSNRNKQDRLAVWIRDAHDKTYMKAGEAVKRCLKLPQGALEFVNHNDSQAKAGSMARVSKRI